MNEKRVCNGDSSFVTLTYDDAHLYEIWQEKGCSTLVREHPQLFMKRLRKKLGDGIRFYGCGEYGETTRRPHYHILLFNRDFDDKKFYKKAPRGENLYTSALLEELWPFGFNVIGDVSFDSCAYVARYVTKKLTGEDTEWHYGGRLPEFPMMSRRPGIGSGYFEKYKDEIYAHDSIVVNGVECTPPRYYDARYELLDSDRLALLKAKRMRAAVDMTRGQTNRRRVTMEKFELEKLKLKRRSV